MYASDFYKTPRSFSRKKFIEKIFKISNNNYDYDTLLIAVEIGDYFVSFKGERKTCNWINFNEEEKNIISSPTPQKYSLELSHVSLCIATKFNEDCVHEIYDVGNKIVFKMEWEILMLLGFHIKTNNFFKFINKILYQSTYHHLTLSPEFEFLAFEIANLNQININPFTILLAIKMLDKKGKLSFLKDFRMKRFYQIVKKICYEYELSFTKFIHNYIMYKKELLY
jgi:hypothetical protein